VACLFDRELLLRAEAAPFRTNDAGTGLLGEFHRAVVAAGVDDQDLVAERQAPQAVRQLARSVLGNQHGRKGLAIVGSHGQL
jgi:hypothetical protein